MFFLPFFSTQGSSCDRRVGSKNPSKIHNKIQYEITNGSGSPSNTAHDFDINNGPINQQALPHVGRLTVIRRFMSALDLLLLVSRTLQCFPQMRGNSYPKLSLF